MSPSFDAGIARNLANCLSSLKALGVTDRHVLSDILRATLERHPEFWGVWTIWEPDALDGRDREFANHAGHDQTGRYVPLWKRTHSGILLEPNVGYAQRGVGDYYLIPMQRRQEVTTTPYEYNPADGVKRVIMSQVAPIFFDGRCVGAAGFDIPVNVAGRAHQQPKPMDLEPRTTQDALSPREREVLSWVSQGKSNSEIGMILSISAHTVKHHMEKIFAKLGVENRHAAMLCALQPFVPRDETGALPAGRSAPVAATARA